ncbi:MAG: gliding motility-associated peptidyl-prolyl isomerase GldI [Polaribacter sp.]|uniref:gliding motility-associated peptidyl-prolyl isomerase GldI n=1 Tax=Polaribacter sp. TaxID=1920175 RepID=UPI0032667C94
MKIKIIIFISFICFGCTKINPRRPIEAKPSTTILKETIKESIKLNKVEDTKISNLIKKDSIHNYILSPKGYWYTYNTKINENTPTPKTGDLVTLEYNLSNLKGETIYSKEILGVKKYNVDKEDFISALQSGIKLMKVGETITFVIPSYNAFGISGDGNKIGINQSIISTVTLINIK